MGRDRLFNVKLYGLTFNEGLATITLNLRVVNKTSAGHQQR